MQMQQAGKARWSNHHRPFAIRNQCALSVLQTLQCGQVAPSVISRKMEAGPICCVIDELPA